MKIVLISRHVCMSKPSDFTEVLTEDLLRQTAYNQEFIEANTYRHPGPQPFQFQPPAPSWFTGDHPYVHTPQVGDHRTFLQDPDEQRRDNQTRKYR